ncbi:hypothetical protein [uncultured Thiodictyon sp.]|uniref:hypothetical protein n=1 Tax=uncultured Thiodictyon sp. TaxID=1846217 RepID=UPI0025DC9108|nr:hypothetical protein [uncultured Thiodictyon sp.]
MRICAFRDITAFILDTASRAGLIDVAVNYVKNADEAHADLKTRQADLVFMSYDDTLSLALQDHDRDIAVVMPVHGGILDLCGELDLARGKAVVGIDTDSGYARALRHYLHGRYPAAEDYARLQWVRAGATNLRYEKLVAGQLDATLLNPPYSLKPGIARLGDLRGSIGAYQGVVANVNQSSLTDARQRAAVIAFIRAFLQTVDDMKAQPEPTIERLAQYYGVPSEDARAVHRRLWEPDGLAVGKELDRDQLVGTERLFSADTGIAVPALRTWVLSL